MNSLIEIIREYENPALVDSVDRSRTDGIGDQREDDLHYDPKPVVADADPTSAAESNDLTPVLDYSNPAPRAVDDDPMPVVDNGDPTPSAGDADPMPGHDNTQGAPVADTDGSQPATDNASPELAADANDSTSVANNYDMAPTAVVDDPKSVVDNGDQTSAGGISDPIPGNDNAEGVPVAPADDSIPVINVNNVSPAPVVGADAPQPVIDSAPQAPAAVVDNLTSDPGRQNGNKREPYERRAAVNLGRHQAQCSICRSEHREILETWFINWESPDKIVEKSVNVSRDSIYRHAHAVGLFSKRLKNLPIALGKIIEKVDSTPVNGSTILSAINLLSKMENEKQAGKNTDPKGLFDRMSPAEREAFASDGTLPEWFSGDDATTPSGKQTQVSQSTASQVVQ